LIEFHNHLATVFNNIEVVQESKLEIKLLHNKIFNLHFIN